MDGDRFDEISRSLARGITRRGLLAGLAGFAAAVAAGRRGSAQVSQAQCGNVSCKRNPGKCNPGCVCCAFGNSNHRCTPPGNCGGSGQPVCPPERPHVDSILGCVQCLTVGHCPAPPGACEAATCAGGVCGVGPASAGTVCRPAAGPCDVEETCTGASTSCPADAAAPDGQPGACPSCQGCAGGACAPVPNDTRCPSVCCAGVCCEDGQACVDGACQAACVPFRGTCDPAADACCQDEPAACVQTCGPAPTCCHPPGGTCGNNCDCCGLDTCDFEAGTCCRERGGSCANGEPCCGLLGCAGGVCCLLIGSGICADDAECCDDAVCGADGFCAPPFCLAVGSACVPDGEPCCREGAVPSTCEMVCDGVETCCNAPGGSCGSNCHCCGVDTCDFDSNVCCRELGGSCAAGEPCCGVLPCVGGVCCQEVGGGGCDADIDCCGDLVCREGVCEAAICVPPQTPCNPAGENTCCQVGGYTVCQEVVGCGDGEPWCCRDLGSACTADCDCCGEFDGCGIDGRCCRGLGGACSDTEVCCADGVCDAGSGGTCRLPDGAFCAFDEECRAGARCVDNACRSAV